MESNESRIWKGIKANSASESTTTVLDGKTPTSFSRSRRRPLWEEQAYAAFLQAVYTDKFCSCLKWKELVMLFIALAFVIVRQFFLDKSLPSFDPNYFSPFYS